MARRGQPAVPRERHTPQGPHWETSAPTAGWLSVLPSLSGHTARTRGTHPLSCAGTAAVDKVVFGVEKNSTFLECLARSPQITMRWLVRRGEETAPSEVRGQGGRAQEQGWLLSPRSDPRALSLLQVRNNGHFLVLEQGLLIRQLSREDVGTYECQAVERSFSRLLTRYSLRLIRHEAAELPPYKRSKGVEPGGTQQSPRPRTELQPGSKGFPRALGAPGTSLDAYCNALRLQERQRQRAWHKWQHQAPDSKNGRVRRHPQRL